MGKKLPKKKKKQQNQRRDPSHERRRSNLNYGNTSIESRNDGKEQTDDRISSLPDEILLLLVSSIPFKSALQTTYLSTQWRGFWNRALVQHGAKEDIDCAIGNFLLHFDELDPLKKHRRLQFHFGKGLVLLAVVGLNKKLHLDFSLGKQEFPREFGWHLVLNSRDPTHQSSSVTFCIRTLNLTSVSYLTNEIVSSLVTNFHSLESLAISKCDGLRSLRVDVVSRLQNLTILDCPHLKSLYIEAYELASFRYRGRLCWFSLRGLHYLADVMLDFRDGPGYRRFEFQHFDKLLLAIRNVTILTLCGWIFEAIVRPWLCSGHKNLKFNNIKDLWWINSSMEEHNIDALFSFLKICPSLKRLFITIDPTSYCMTSIGGECTNQNNSQAQLRRLKVVKLEGFTDKEDVISLKEHLLELFNVEPLIVTASPGSEYPQCLIRIPKQQNKSILKKGAPQARKRKYSYKFVEEVQDNIGLCSKHAHMDLLPPF